MTHSYSVTRVGHKHVRVNCTGHKPQTFDLEELRKSTRHAEAFEGSLYMEAMQRARQLLESQERKSVMKFISKEWAVVLTWIAIFLCILLVVLKNWSW